MAGLRQENAELKAQLHLFSTCTNRQFTMLNQKVRHIAAQPAHVIGHNARAAAMENTEGTAEAAPMATLSPHPRSVHTLWQEYEFGIAPEKQQKTLQQQNKET
jgi:hypothetical protein